MEEGETIIIKPEESHREEASTKIEDTIITATAVEGITSHRHPSRAKPVEIASVITPPPLARTALTAEDRDSTIDRANETRTGRETHREIEIET